MFEPLVASSTPRPARPAFDTSALNLSSRAAMQRTESQPTTEVLGSRKPAHIRTYFAEDHQRRVGVYPFQHRQIDSRHAIQPRGDIEGGIIGPSLPHPPNLAERARPPFTPIRERAQVRLQLLITKAQLLSVTLI